MRDLSQMTLTFSERHLLFMFLNLFVLQEHVPALSNPANFRNSVLLQTLAISADCETSKTGLSVSLTL